MRYLSVSVHITPCAVVFTRRRTLQWPMHINPFSVGTVFIRQNLTSVDRLYTSDICRRQILTEINKIFIMVVDPYHRYSNEPDRAN